MRPENARIGDDLPLRQGSSRTRTRRLMRSSPQCHTKTAWPCCAKDPFETSIRLHLAERGAIHRNDRRTPSGWSATRRMRETATGTRERQSWNPLHAHNGSLMRRAFSPPIGFRGRVPFSEWPLSARSIRPALADRRDADYTLRWFPRTASLGRNLGVVSGVAGCGMGNVPGFPGQAVVIRAGR